MCHTVPNHIRRLIGIVSDSYFTGPRISGSTCVNMIDALTDNAFNVAFKTSGGKNTLVF